MPNSKRYYFRRRFNLRSIVGVQSIVAAKLFIHRRRESLLWLQRHCTKREILTDWSVSWKILQDHIGEPKAG